MRAKLIPGSGFGWLASVLVLLAAGEFRVAAADMKLQVFLLWGTNESKPPPGKAYTTVDADIAQKLKELPLKWTNWFEVNRKCFTVSKGETSKVPVSAKCQVKVRKLDTSELEVCLIGKGKEVMNRKQSLPKGEMLVLGGNAPNSTAWLVVLKRID